MHRRSCFSTIKRIVTAVITISVLMFSAIGASAMNFEFEDAVKSVFVVMSGDPYNPYGGDISLGSGFAIAKHYIITNAHVISDENNTYVACYSETDENNIGDSYTVTVVAMDAALDIAILYLPDIEVTPLEIADVDTIKEGDKVFAIGTPEGLAFTLTSGSISSKLRVLNNVKYVQTDAAINQGNSGGPLLNEDGRVIGVNTLRLQNTDNIGFAIRIDMVTEFFETHVGSLEPTETVPVETETEAPASESASVTPPVSSAVENSTATATDTASRDDDAPIYITDDGGNDGSVNIVLIILPVIGIIGIVVAIVLRVVLVSKAQSGYDTDAELDAYAARDIAPPQPMQREMRPDTNGCICILGGDMAGMRVTVGSGENVILGKDPKFANIVFDAGYLKVSRIHCTVTYSEIDGKYMVVDSSSNGTYYDDGMPLPKNTRVAVERGTVLKLADDNCKIKLI